MVLRERARDVADRRHADGEAVGRLEQPERRVHLPVATAHPKEPAHRRSFALCVDRVERSRRSALRLDRFSEARPWAVLEQYGVEWRGSRPIGRLREAHRMIRTLLDEGSIDF